ncbi:MAG: energy-coupling factor transporter transmembrane component T family protein [Lachnospiraceae bacterium]
MRELTIGQYYAADSPVHALDPRTKLMAVLVYIFVLFMVKEPVWYIPVFVILLLLYRYARIPFGYFLRGIRGIVLLLFFTFAMRLIALMITGASLLSYTTTPKALADGLEKSLSFLEKFGVPIRSMAVIVMIAFRFIPVLTEETNILIEAQKARGAEFENCFIWKKCRNVSMILLPLFLSVIRRSTDLAMAMEARGYRENHPATRMNPLVYSRADKITYVIIFSYGVIMTALMYTQAAG